MTPVETLREAARLMRERAEAATPGPWTSTMWGVHGPGRERVAPFDGDGPVMRDRLYIASWHPAVALAVADWLDEAAEWMAAGALFGEHNTRALVVARAYLGEA